MPWRSLVGGGSGGSRRGGLDGRFEPRRTSRKGGGCFGARGSSGSCRCRRLHSRTDNGRKCLKIVSRLASCRYLQSSLVVWRFEMTRCFAAETIPRERDQKQEEPLHHGAGVVLRGFFLRYTSMHTLALAVGHCQKGRGSLLVVDTPSTHNPQRRDDGLFLVDEGLLFCDPDAFLGFGKFKFF